MNIYIYIMENEWSTENLLNPFFFYVLLPGGDVDVKDETLMGNFVWHKNVTNEFGHDVWHLYLTMHVGCISDHVEF